MKNIRLFLLLTTSFSLAYFVAYMLFRGNPIFHAVQSILAGFGIVWIAWAIIAYIELKKYYEDE